MTYLVVYFGLFISTIGIANQSDSETQTEKLYRSKSNQKSDKRSDRTPLQRPFRDDYLISPVRNPAYIEKYSQPTAGLVITMPEINSTNSKVKFKYSGLGHGFLFGYGDPVFQLGAMILSHKLDVSSPSLTSTTTTSRSLGLQLGTKIPFQDGELAVAGGIEQSTSINEVTKYNTDSTLFGIYYTKGNRRLGIFSHAITDFSPEFYFYGYQMSPQRGIDGQMLFKGRITVRLIVSQKMPIFKDTHKPVIRKVIQTGIKLRIGEIKAKIDILPDSDKANPTSVIQTFGLSYFRKINQIEIAGDLSIASLKSNSETANLRFMLFKMMYEFNG